jgi:hypothetical protein
MLYLCFVLFVLINFPLFYGGVWVSREWKGLRGFPLFSLKSGSGGCTIAIVALVTINEDQKKKKNPSKILVPYI